jgi:anti-sigma factor RsiW
MKPSDSLNPTGDHADIAGYLIHSLTPEQQAQVEEHLAGCAECRAEVESLREWTAALEAVPEAMLLDGPPDDADLLLQRTLREFRA